MPSDPPPKRARTNGEEGPAAGGRECSGAESGSKSPLPPPSTGSDGDVCCPGGPISPRVLERGEELADACAAARPFPHGVVRDFCAEGFLERILEELKHHSKVKFKETDLFRVYQSIDLGNLRAGSDLALKMPALMGLRDAVYSPRFRAFVERVAGLDPGTLTDEVDCAANCHAKGCHLLCHDDVIGTRKVSYIIYLTDPAPEWRDEDGGRLELYDAVAEDGEEGDSRRRVPGALPVATVLPAFNSMAYFVVRPGVSFHSVQEVFCDRPRLSIQGWFHAGKAPPEIENATLQRLKSTGKGEDTEGEFENMMSHDSDNATLSSEDMSFLRKYINPAYLSDESMTEMRTRFEEESSVKLRHFISEDWNERIRDALTKNDEMDKLGKDRPSLNYSIGMSDEWKVVGPAHKQRFLQYEPRNERPDASDVNLDAGGLLHRLRDEVFRSAAFGRWLGRISSLGFPPGQRGRVRRFRPGLDYTVAHYGVLTTTPVLDATLCFCAGRGEPCAFDEETNELVGSDDDAVWESGDAGGFECYIAADDEGEERGPDAEYDDEDDTRLLSVSASNNTLSLVYRDPGTMRFVKYVGIGAPSSRWDVALEYDVRSDVANEQDGEGKDGGES